MKPENARRGRRPLLTLGSVLALLALVVVQSVMQWPARGSVRAQTASEPAARVHVAPFMLETGTGRPVRAEWITVIVPETRPADPATDDAASSNSQVMAPLLRFPTAADEPGPPIFVVTANLFAPNRPLPENDQLLAFVSLFNDQADVLVMGLRGFAGAQPNLRCASSYSATLTEPGNRALLAADLGAYFSTCDEFWTNAGVTTAAYNAANMAADLDAARAALGYTSMSLIGIDFGSQIALETARTFPKSVARMLLILPIGPDQLLKLPANVQQQLARLAQRVQADPRLATQIPDFLGLVETVVARLEAQPVTATVRDPLTQARVDITLGAYDLQLATSRALTTGAQWSLPARYFEMSQGDFTWLAQQAYARRTDINANLTYLTALCASGASDARRAQVEAEAPAMLLGDAINGIGFDLCIAVRDPDLGEAFRADVVTDVPTLFVVGTMDAFAPPANVDALIAGFSNGQSLVVENGSHELLAEALPLIAPSLRQFMRADAAQLSGTQAPTATVPATNPLTVTLPSTVVVQVDLEPVQIEPVTGVVWTGQYFNNRTLQGDPTITREDAAIDFDWGEGSPSPDIAADNFSARWTTAIDLPAGTYRVSLWVDDGVRMWVDDVLVVDYWVEGAARNFVTDIKLVRGRHYVRVEYFEAEGLALARMSVARVENYPDWRAEYFDNTELAGAPVVIRNERTIAADWRAGAPVIGVPAENFSVRWTRRVALPAGAYDLALNVTGGARLWLDGQLLIDDWQPGPSRLLTVQTPPLTGGEHDLRVEYFKTVGDGAISLRWTPAAAVAVPPRAVIRAPAYAQVGQSITLDGTASVAGSGGEITSFAWDLGDGNASAGNIVEYGYTAPGLYNVTLTVTDAMGLFDTSTVQIRVDDAPVTPAPEQPPVPVILAPAQGLVGEPVPFDASQSQSVNPIVSFAWQFGDGSTANAVLVNKTYAAPGIYNVVLTLEDSAGLTRSTNRLISIFAPTPTATPNLPPTPTPIPPTPTPLLPETPPTPVVTATPELPPEVAPTATVPPEIATLTPQPTLDPNAMPTVEGATPPVEGTPTVVLVQPIARFQAIADGQPLPEIIENGVPVVTVAPGRTVVFDASETSPGSSAVTSYFWSVGDAYSQPGVDVTLVYQFTEQGRYPVTLTVENADGLAASAVMIVDVRPLE